MNTKKAHFLFLLSMLLVLSLACSSISEFSATATPVPTQTFTPTPPPTSTPTPAGLVAADGSTLVTKFGTLELSNELYEHPDGWVSFYPMKGWEIEANDFSVTMYEPSTNVSFYITATNTGYTLNEEAYTNFRNNMEEFYFYQDQYKELNRGSNEDISLYFVEKQYARVDASAQIYAVSIYQQFDEVIYTIEMVGNTAFANGNSDNPYRVMFDSFSRTIETNTQVAATLPLYQYSWEYVSPTTNASISAPWAWSFFIVEDDKSYIAAFESPDAVAGSRLINLDTLKITDATAKSLGKDLTLAFLSGFTGDTEVYIIEDGEVKDKAPGQYIYGWEAPNSNISGVLFYDINIANQLVMVIVYSQTDQLPVYGDLLTTIGDSYIPAP